MTCREQRWTEEISQVKKNPETDVKDECGLSISSIFSGRFTRLEPRLPSISTYKQIG